MKIRARFIFVLLLSSFSILLGQSKFSEIEKFFSITGYLLDEKVLTEKVNGKNYEIWLKDKKTKAFIPKIQRSTGSCFFIMTETDFYLVTAAHVAKQTTLNTKIIVSSEKDKPIVYNLKYLIHEKSKLEWTTHPHADVAVVHLNEKFILDNLYGLFLPFEFININLEAPFREREVTVYGYPLGLGIGKNISPITKTSKPSSGLIDLPRFDNKIITTFFLLDDPGVSGFSGGPVFELPQQIGTGDKSLWVTVYRIMGLVHGTISDNKAGGFSAIVPSKFIKETIELAPGLTGTLDYKYKDGTIWSERLYKNGVPWTVLSNYKKNGDDQNGGTLKDGNGTLYIYDESSKLLEVRTYMNGHLEKIESAST